MAEEEGESVESEEGEEGGKKKSKKKLIIMVVLMLAIGYEAASMTILKPPPLTPAQKQAKADKAKFELETKCAIANSQKLPDPPASMEKKDKKSSKKTTETTAAPEPEVGLPVLVLDSVTINLNGSGNHYLKLGLGLQMPKGTVLETVKLENPGSAALNFVISELRKKTLDELAKGDLTPLQHELGYKVCTDPALNYDEQITSIYFTDFVTQ